MKLSFTPLTVFVAMIFSFNIIVDEVSARAIEPLKVGEAKEFVVKISSRTPGICDIELTVNFLIHCNRGEETGSLGSLVAPRAGL
ncbi:hypothetical protein C8R44DRAFT_790307 [Mycena epipterygia]|nr:hypothetical protein C8R44DRAFT_790307 [Mycena epipterygia]